ncbi:MAG: tRNA (Guanine37-N1) -methyltransferase [Labilithrix sp.]|nr:tRNA (Guanine37-N1) -methyltransferase [Labilithrix sp.]
MRVDVVTLFPELFDTFLKTSFVGRAMTGGQLEVRLRSPRDFGLGKHKSVDDTPYGGGSGMVMRVDVMVACMESLDADAEAEGKPRARRVLLTPQGQPFAQPIAARFSVEPALMLVCGRYEGFDERIRGFVDEEISLGDFVMTGGEIAAMAVIEAAVRLIPGVLGNAASTHEESHAEGGMLEYPQYTRPAEFRGQTVPEVLTGGNHAHIEAWRKAQSEERTRARRPDLLVDKERG